MICIGALCLLLLSVGAQTPSPAPDDQSPTTAKPTSSTTTPTYAPRECWANLTELYIDLERKAPFSLNTYVVCPNQTYDIGYSYGTTGECCNNGDLPIFARANTHFKCGDDGSSGNNCILRGGTASVVFNPFVFNELLSGVKIQGFTFQSPVKTTLFAAGSGDVTFIDCIVKDQQNEGPIVSVYDPSFEARKLEETIELMGDTPWERLEYVMRKDYMDEVLEQSQKRLEERRNGIEGGNDSSRMLQGTDLLVMTFEECVFQNNSQGDPGYSTPTFGVVSAIADGSVIIIKDCIFAQNVYNGQSEFGSSGYAISTIQSDIVLTNSCFIDNDFSGYGTVQIFDESAYQLDGNYVSAGDTGLRCPFVAFDLILPTAPENVTDCLPANATTCQASIYERWLATQSNAPASPGPAAPSVPSPAGRPTLPPRPTTTREPTSSMVSNSPTSSAHVALVHWSPFLFMAAVMWQL